MVGAGAWVAGVREFESSRMICNKKLARALQKKIIIIKIKIKIKI